MTYAGIGRFLPFVLLTAAAMVGGAVAQDDPAGRAEDAAVRPADEKDFWSFFKDLGIEVNPPRVGSGSTGDGGTGDGGSSGGGGGGGSGGSGGGGGDSGSSGGHGG